MLVTGAIARRVVARGRAELVHGVTSIVAADDDLDVPGCEICVYIS